MKKIILSSFLFATLNAALIPNDTIHIKFEGNTYYSTANMLKILDIKSNEVNKKNFVGDYVNKLLKKIRAENSYKDVKAFYNKKRSILTFKLVEKRVITSVKIKNFKENNFSLIIIDNITDLFSYEYKNNQSIFKKNSLFMKYMRELSLYAVTHKVPIVITNMIRNSNEQEVENMSTAIDLFTHIKIHLFKNSSIYNGEISSPFNKENFSYTITSSGLSDDDF